MRGLAKCRNCRDLEERLDGWYRGAMLYRGGMLVMLGILGIASYIYLR